MFLKSFLEQLGSIGNGFSPEQIIRIVMALVVSLLLGMFINVVYKKFYRGVVYNRNFSIALVGMTVLTAMVTLAISTNIVISLGMVGALSIVRFVLPSKPLIWLPVLGHHHRYHGRQCLSSGPDIGYRCLHPHTGHDRKKPKRPHLYCYCPLLRPDHRR